MLVKLLIRIPESDVLDIEGGGLDVVVGSHAHLLILKYFFFYRGVYCSLQFDILPPPP